MYKPELLAPAGSRESLIAAVENGADAVYFGGRLFSARQYASNFNHEELESAIDHAHLRGVKAYVTVNTLIKDSELEEICGYLQYLCRCGVDAVIVHDLGILKLLHEQLPRLPVHASTQMSIHNTEGVKLLQSMGVKRVILARELSLDEIRKIRSETAVEIEIFIHGALCFSYSGQCLLSSMIGGRSGNRGCCAQPCRKKYRINEVEGYLLSPKDLNMSEHIGALISEGIDSFKIEGRMKRPEYVAGVVRVYRKLIDRYFEAPENFKVSENEKHMLLQLFNREFTTGYFFGNPGNELISRKYPHNRGTYLGKVVDYEKRKKMASILLEAQLRAGDGIGTEGRETGVIIGNMSVDNHSAAAATSGSIVKISLDEEVEKGEAVFKTYDSQLMALLGTRNIRKVPLRISFKARVGEDAELIISDGENEITVHGSNACRAKSKPISKSSIANQLKKLGNTIFEAQRITFEIDDDIFIPVSELNSLRRSAITKLERERMQKWERECKKPVISIEKKDAGSKHILSVNTDSIENLEAAVDHGADVVYIGDMLEKQDCIYAIEYGRKRGVSIFLSTPRIMKEVRDLSNLNPDGFLVSNPGVLYHLCNIDKVKPIVIDYPFNVFNRLSMEHLLKFSQRVTLSPELTLKEVRALTSFGQTECIVHGFLTLMASEHDLAGGVCLKDEKGFVFPVRKDKQHRTYIMNSRELCMLEYVPEIIKAGVNSLRIEAGTYDKEKTGKITAVYREAVDDAVSGRRVNKSCDSKYTTGHYFRGVL